MGRNTPARVVAVLLALSVLFGASPVVAATPASVQSEEGLKVAMDAMRQLATDTRYNHDRKKTTRPRKGLPVNLGKDGRLTVLLIGSDWRKSSGVNASTWSWSRPSTPRPARPRS